MHICQATSSGRGSTATPAPPEEQTTGETQANEDGEEGESEGDEPEIGKAESLEDGDAIEKGEGDSIEYLVGWDVKMEQAWRLPEGAKPSEKQFTEDLGPLDEKADMESPIVARSKQEKTHIS